MLIKDGFVVDGTGSTWYRADVGIDDGKITEVCRNLPMSGADRVIDAKGLVVCPGFFDMHCHAEVSYFCKESGPIGPRCNGTIQQGVTTHFNGQCGLSWSGPLRGASLERVKSRARDLDLSVEVDWKNLGEYMDKLEKFGGVSVNSAYMVGFGTVRMSVIGHERGPPTKDEMEEMKASVAEAMEAGAFGLSTGLEYPPQNFAETDEVVELAKVAAMYGGIHQAHVRRHGHLSDPRSGRAFLSPVRDTMFEAVRECIEIGERAGIPTVWSHAKAASGWKIKGQAEKLLREVDNARRRGVDITIDHWADVWKGTPPSQVFPLWLYEGGNEKMRERLKDPETRSNIKSIVKENLCGMSPTQDFLNGIIGSVMLEKNKDLVGKTLLEAAEMRGKEPEELFLDMAEEGDMPVPVGRCQSDEDLLAMLRHPAALFGTDSVRPSMLSGPAAIAAGGWYKLYPRVLREYVREMRVITLEETIRKMTSASATRLGIMDRGLIRPGMCADIVVFDPINVRERDGAYPEGIPYVLVNGIVTVNKGEHTGARAGKILKHKYYLKQ